MAPAQVLITATLASSCGFMLPVATPPNTLVYDTGKIPFKNLIKAGFWLDIASIILLTVVAFTLLKVI
jgi:sodium-dependent dicarboxylate transporter 2/3/5